ncbi:hypothetical protein JCM10213v2_003267 [Rhodosporidiobolus nylandii]
MRLTLLPPLALLPSLSLALAFSLSLIPAVAAARKHGAALIPPSHAHAHAQHRRLLHPQREKLEKLVRRASSSSSSRCKKKKEKKKKEAAVRAAAAAAASSSSSASDIDNGAGTVSFPTLAPSSSSSSFLTSRAPRTSTRTSYPSPSSSPPAPSSSPPVPSSSSTPSPYPSPSTGSGLINYTDARCGLSGATEESEQGAGPNGSERWLNCGVDEGGWSPPTLRLTQLKTLTLSSALALPNSVYAACRSFQPLFEKYADEEGLPPVLLMAFAMQESSCNPSTMGDGGGAFGLMQITADKCGSAPDGDCADPSYNIATAAKYFSSTLKSFDGDFLLALGAYNGWYEGLTHEAATAAAGSGCCECQQNLDYLHQMLNVRPSLFSLAHPGLSPSSIPSLPPAAWSPPSPSPAGVLPLRAAPALTPCLPHRAAPRAAYSLPPPFTRSQGWLLGLDGSQLGTERNLDVC